MGVIARHATRYAICLALFVCPGLVRADLARIAVATNFLDPAQALAREYEAATGHEITVISGSTGTLFAQIVQGAPYHAFLSADQDRPSQLVARGLAEQGAVFTYARGRLVVWSATMTGIDDGQTALFSPNTRRIAIANPALAPYGRAARQTLNALGPWEELAPKIVLGENIAQTFAMVATGNTDIGIVAATQLAMTNRGGSRWDVPETLHDPILQDAVLLQGGRDNPAAVGFLEFLRNDHARAAITAFGYGVP